MCDQMIYLEFRSILFKFTDYIGKLTLAKGTGGFFNYLQQQKKKRSE